MANGNRDILDKLQRALMGQQQTAQAPMQLGEAFPEQSDMVAPEPIEEPVESAATDAKLARLNEEAKSPNMKTKPELAEDQLEQQLDKTTQGQLDEDDTAGAAKQEDPMLQQYKQAIEQYKAKLADPKKQQFGVMDALPDILTGLYNISNRAQGGQLPEMKMPQSIARKKAAAKEARAEELGGLDKLQSMYSKYAAMKGKGKGEMTEAQRLRLELSRERLEETREDRERKKQQFDIGEERRREKMERLSDKEVDSITQLDEGVRMTGEIDNLLENTDAGDYLGPYASRIEGNVDLIPGMNINPDFVELRQRVGTQLADYVKSISGAAVSEEEAQRLALNIPKVTDKPEAFKRKLETFKNDLNELRRTALENIGKQKKSAEKFKTKSNEGSGPKEVKRKTKDGKVAIFDAETKDFLRYE